MRLIFLYMYGGSSPKKLPYDPSIPAKNGLAINFHTEGYAYLLEALLREKVVDEIIVFIDSTRGSGFYQSGNLPIYVIPNIAHVDDYLKKDDIIWVRGGFRSWHDWLLGKEWQYWQMLYAANTGRQRWKFWDVVFDDLTGHHSVDKRQRWFFDFRKPVNESIFYPQDQPKVYDVCIGASHIHDKKAQWRFVKVAIHFKRLFNYNLKCVLPGRIMRGIGTNNIMSDIKEHNLNIETPGMVPREQVAQLMNQSKFYVHMAGYGQNDRGPLEAMACGTKVILTAPHRHHPTLSANPIAGEVFKSGSPEKFAWLIRDLLVHYNENNKPLIANYFQSTHGVTTTVKTFRGLLNLLNSVSRSEYKGTIEGLMKRWLRNQKPQKTMQNQKVL